MRKLGTTGFRKGRSGTASVNNSMQAFRCWNPSTEMQKQMCPGCSHRSILSTSACLKQTFLMLGLEHSEAALMGRAGRPRGRPLPLRPPTMDFWAPTHLQGQTPQPQPLVRLPPTHTSTSPSHRAPHDLFNCLCHRDLLLTRAVAVATKHRACCSS